LVVEQFMIVFGIVVMYYIVSASYGPASRLALFEVMLNP
jgi:hypothetical protein